MDYRKLLIYLHFRRAHKAGEPPESYLIVILAELVYSSVTPLLHIFISIWYTHWIHLRLYNVEFCILI